MLQFTEGIDEYKKCLASDKAPENTIRTHMSAINRFHSQCQLDNIEDVTAAVIRDYKDYLSDNGAGGKSINLYMSYLRSFFTRLREDEYINRDIAKFCRNYKTRVAENELGSRQKSYRGDVKKFITKEHRKKMLATALAIKFGRRNVLLLETALYCGLRESEVINLRPCDIKDGFMTVVNSKRNKTRTFCVLDSTYLANLLSYIEANLISETDYIFKSKNGKKMTIQDYDWIFRNILRISNIPAGRDKGGYTTHDLRGTFITCMFDAGMTADDIAEIVGHSNVRQTMAYRRKNNSEEKLNRHKAIYRKAGMK